VGAVVLCAGAVLAMAGCETPVKHAERLARLGGLHALVLSGDRFQHRAYAADRGKGGLLVLFVEGDGTPWMHQGTRVAVDPTPRAPLALKLAVETPDSVLYLGRPCYYGIQPHPLCASEYWTSKRYSTEVVASMATAATAYADAHGFGKVLLVGYSGGGTLVILMARRMPLAVGVITIAANLDPETWAALHGYLPLTGSLNPSVEPSLPGTVAEWHLVGDRDTNVPQTAAARYLARVPPARIWRYATFDHICCWEQEWPAVLRRVRAELANTDP